MLTQEHMLTILVDLIEHWCWYWQHLFCATLIHPDPPVCLLEVQEDIQRYFHRSYHVVMTDEEAAALQRQLTTTLLLFHPEYFEPLHDG